MSQNACVCMRLFHDEPSGRPVLPIASGIRIRGRWPFTIDDDPAAGPETRSWRLKQADAEYAWFIATMASSGGVARCGDPQLDHEPRCSIADVDPWRRTALAIVLRLHELRQCISGWHGQRGDRQPQKQKRPADQRPPICR